MDNQKELFEQFMHNNMPDEPFDPDKALAAAKVAVPEYEPSEHFKKGMRRLLRQSKRQARMASVKGFFTSKGIPQIAVSLSVIICTVLVAQANNGAIFDLLFQTHQTHTGVQLTDQIRQRLLSDQLDQLGEVDMPVFFPRYLPKGYAITNIEGSSDKVTFQLMNGSHFIFITQTALNGYNSEVDLDSEKTDLEQVTINQQTAFYREKNGIQYLFFFDNFNYYKMKADALSKKEVIRIAESFEMVV